MNRIVRSTITFLTAATLLLLGSNINATTDSIGSTLLPVNKAFKFIGAHRHGDTLKLRWRIAPGYYLYRDSLSVESIDQPNQQIALQPPAPVFINEPAIGRVAVYRGQLTISVAAPKQSSAPKRMQVRYQGCASVGVCYPPQVQVFTVPG